VPAAPWRDNSIVGGYGQYCPVTLGAEVFAERWTPIVLRNLMLGCERFGQILEGAPGMPRSTLSQRLDRLEAKGVLIRTATPSGPTYHLTEAGRELGEVCLSLGAWAARWLDARPEDLDPYLALWMLTQLIDPHSLPRDRVVVRFDLTDRSRPNRYWLVLSHTEAEVCAEFPGFAEDAVVTTDAPGPIRWHTGRVTLPTALRADSIRVDGPRWTVRLLTQWGRLSPYAGVAPAASRTLHHPAPTHRASTGSRDVESAQRT